MAPYTWFVKAYDLAGSTTSSNTFNLTVNVPLPAKPATPTGIDSLCVNPANSTFTTTGANYATSYIWSISPSGAGTIMGTGFTATVSWNSTFTGSVQITVKGHNTQGDGPVSDVKTTFIKSLPAQAAKPTGIATLCVNPANTTYTTTGAINATSYIWSISPVNAGNITGTGMISTVTWSSTYTGNATISVKGHNICGDGSVSTGLTVAINPKPDQAAKPSGITSLCQNNPNTVYTTTGAVNALSYTWFLLPANAGTLTPDVTQKNATAAWNSTFTGIVKIAVQGHNSCGDGLTSDTLVITVSPLPGAASTISGSATVCQGQSSVTYTVPVSANATSYIWTLPQGATGSSTTNSITVNYNNSAHLGNITVKGHNGCGDGAISSLAIVVNSLPLQAFIPTGATSLCINPANTDYTADSAAYATSYIWSISPVNAGTTNGSGKTSTVTWNSTYTGNVTITVKGHNVCGDGIASTGLTVTINPKPDKTLKPSGTITLCQNNPNTVYTITGAVNALTYAWSILPSNAGTLTPDVTQKNATIDWDNTFAGTAKLTVQVIIPAVMA